MAGNTNEIFASVDNTWARTTPTLSSTTTFSEYHQFVLVGIQGGTANDHGKRQRCTDLKHVWNLPLIQVKISTNAAM